MTALHEKENSMTQKRQMHELCPAHPRLTLVHGDWAARGAKGAVVLTPKPGPEPRINGAQSLRRPAGLAVPLHHPGDGRAADDLLPSDGLAGRTQSSIPQPAGSRGALKDQGRISRDAQSDERHAERPSGRSRSSAAIRSPSRRIWAGTAGTSGRTMSRTRSCATRPRPWSRAA